MCSGSEESGILEEVASDENIEDSKTFALKK
jgi:hypothetical protein